MPSTNLANGNPAIADKITFADFAPDRDPATPGALLATGNIYPSQRGFRSYPGLRPTVASALPSPALGGFTTVFPGNTVVTIAATASQLYLYQADDWVTVSQGLILNTASRWSFDQYGGWVIAANGVDLPLYYTGVGAFSPLPGSPPLAGIVQASNYSLFLIEPNSNKWWSSLSAILWTPAIATQTVTGRLDQTPGEITAAHKLRAGMALYKRKALHFGTFAGPPFYWDFQLVSAQTGAPGQDAVANLGDVQYWPGPEDFYSFDGYALNRVPNNLKDWFFDRLDGPNAHRIAARWDQRRDLIFWHFPDRQASPAGTLNAWVCFNRRTGKWTSSQRGYTEELDYPFFMPLQTGALTYLRLGQARPTYASFSGLRYGDLVSMSIDVSGAIRKSDHRLSYYSEPDAPAMLTTHDFGDYDNLYQITRLRPRFSIKPTAGTTIRPITQYVGGSPPAPALVRALSTDGSYNLRSTARMQRFELVFNSEAEIIGLDCLVEYAGER